MKKAIITGATGAIGMALISKLLEQNVQILVITRKDSKRNRNILKDKLLKVIYCDLDKLLSIENVNNEKYDVFYHFAWDGTTGDKRNDMYVQNNNIKYSLDAVRLAHKFGCGLFIGAGSQAEYGLFCDKLSSFTPTFPFTGYGMAKLCAGGMTRALANQFGMKHIWTRILSVYGPFDNKCSLIMSLLDKFSNNVSVDMTKGEQVWDYIYSKDVAEIFYLLYEKGIDGKTYVIGSGTTKKIMDYALIMKSRMGSNSIINFGAIPYSDKQVMYLCADNSDIVNDLNYVCKYDFESGIDELIEWYRMGGFDEN